MIDEVDVVVVGAGFAGLYALHEFRDRMGLRVRVFERGSDVGGTWFWNRYPGARCDVESMFYSYSFDSNLEQDWEWTERYPTQPEILAYASFVADRFDLRRSIDFATTVAGATFDEATNHWTIATDTGERVRTRFLVTAVGCLSASQAPTIEGAVDFQGVITHTGDWPDGLDVSGKRVAVIGTGSSGVQAIPEIARRAASLTVFQRTPHFVIPAGNRPLAEGEAQAIKDDYRSWRSVCRAMPSGTPIEMPLGSIHEFDAHAVRAEFDRRWNAGGTNLLTAFNDTSITIPANDILSDYVRERIAQTVHDPMVAAALTPHGYPLGAKRIALGTGYYDTFNRDNVSLVDVREHPIERLTNAGIVAGDVEHEFDVIVFATGFDALTGAIVALNITGTDGRTIAEHWAAGPRTYLGLASAGFPNLFMLTGPGSPSVLANVMVSIEQHVEWVAGLIGYARDNDVDRVEAEVREQDEWVEVVNDIAAQTLFVKASSWYLGANVPGKPRVFMPYAGGIAAYSKTCDEVASDGYRGFTLASSRSEQLLGA